MEYNPLAPPDLPASREEILERTKQVAKRIVEDVRRVVHNHEHDVSLSGERLRPRRTDSAS